MDKIEWKCPKCGVSDLYDFWCECRAPAIDYESHGETVDDPCINAYCDRCKWRGTLPCLPADKKS